ncbi:MAG: M48 family metallopeptidase [Balneolaceae bacterium]
MDFFQAQEKAKSKTWKLILLYVLAVFTLICAIYLVVLFIFDYQGGEVNGIWNPVLFFTVSTFTILIILAGTIFRVMQLRKGGSAVAEMLGGRKLDPSTTDFKERQLRNVVEEMSIASGLPVPDIYILDNEPSINAFAAGYGPRDAAVGVTRGTLDQLNRDELQGVIAHEFSHIFNGDMRINIRLIGILNGILLLHLMGMILMRSSFFAGRGRSSRNGKDGGAFAILALGLSLIIIGYIGMIFGRMIQAAVSRQREYLADAAAVQYTRNPDGLAGALRKIASKAGSGSELEDGHAMELSHLFFANSYKSAMSSLLASHPPIEKRIMAIDPSHDALSAKESERVRKRMEKYRVEQPKSGGGPANDSGGFGELFSPELILAAVGTLGQNDLTHVQKVMKELPEEISTAVHNPLEAEALIYALLLSGEKEVSVNQLATISNHSGEEVAQAVEKVQPNLKKVKPEWNLLIVDLAIPALKGLSEKQYKQFKHTIEELIQADDKITIFEFALEKVIFHNLDAQFNKQPESKIKYHNLKPLGSELSYLLSAMAHASDGETREAWDASLKSIEKIRPKEMELFEQEKCTFENIDKAIEAFAQSARPVQKYVLSATIHAVAADGVMSRKEIELLRAISISIDCPLPIMAP